jgi:hypothetical protein
MRGLSQRNAGRLGEDGAVGFLEKGELALDQGPEKLLAALRDILKKLAGEQTTATTA